MEKIKAAIAMAAEGRWESAVELNSSILRDFPDDQEAYNRLGKALSEIGRNREAIEAFQRALELSPHNAIARKNLERLTRLGDDAPLSSSQGGPPNRAFIEESGKAGVTSLVNLAPPEALIKLAPGHLLQILMDGGGLKMTTSSSDCVGMVEPKMASRLTRLMKGGNRYEATVTSVGERELTVIIREVYKHPSQAAIVSFPSRESGDYPLYLPPAVLAGDVGEEGRERERIVVKDWSDDDTEPGDDEAFSPIVHRIINAGEEAMEGEEDGF